MMIRFLKSPAVPALLVSALLQISSPVQAAPTNDTPLFTDPIIATGQGFEVKRSQVDDAFVDYNANVASAGRSIADAEKPTVRAKLLDHIIINKILIKKATDDDKTTVKKLVDDNLAEARKRAGSQEAFDLEIKATGMSYDQVRDRMFEEQICRRVLVHNTTNGIVIPEEDIKKFYQDYPDKFKIAEHVKVAHILIATTDPQTQQPVAPDEKKEKLKLAQDIEARAQKGEDFAALVMKYSDDAASKNKGGEYTVTRGQTVPEFEAASFSMKTNQISDLVETKFGYHIIKLLEKTPASTVDYAKAEPDIRDYLVEQAAEKVLPDYLKKIKSDADVKILDAAYNLPASAPMAAPVK